MRFWIAPPKPPRFPLILGQRESGEPVEFSGEGSLLTVGPPGTGKSRGVAVWNLRACPSSMLVTDPKGELAGWSADYRARTLGHRVAVLDPFRVTGDRFEAVAVNPLSPLLAAAESGSGVLSEAERLAVMLLPDNPGAKDPYWRQGARSLVVACLLYLARLAPARCHLPGLYDALWMDEEGFVAGVLQPMENAGGRLAQIARDVASTLGRRPKEFGTFRTEARQAVAIFAEDEPCGRVSLASSLDFAELLAGRLTVFLILPPDKIGSHGRWMGLVVSHAIHAILTGGGSDHTRGNGVARKAEGSRECLFLLDEFRNLGRLSGIVDAVALGRSYGLRVWAFVQDLAQLDALYGKDEAAALKSQAEVLQVLGCRSVELAREIEARAGQRLRSSYSLGLPDPGDPAGPLRPGMGEAVANVLPAAAILEMPKGSQILIRHGFQPVVARVALWTG